MKYRFLIIVFLIFLLIFVIYSLNKDKKIYYFNIMDNKYSFLTYNRLLKKNIPNLEKYISYEKEDIRITDLIRDIDDNKEIDHKKIQNILVKADLITLSIGNNEINYKIKTAKVSELYDYIDEVLNDLEKLLKQIRFYSKEKIYLIGFYIDNDYYTELLNYINVKTADLCNNYNIVYLEQNNIFNKTTNVDIYKKVKKSYCIK